MENHIFELVDELSRMKSGTSEGHFTLMKLSTCWKAMFFTPDLVSGRGREQVNAVPPGKTMEEAILIAISEYLKEIRIIKSSGPPSAIPMNHGEEKPVTALSSIIDDLPF